MTSPNSTCVLLLGVLAACAPSVAAPAPEPVLAAVDCAHRVVERHGFLAEWGTDVFPSPQPLKDPLGFTVQRGEGSGRETVSVSIASNPATGAVEAMAWGSGGWLSGGVAIPTTNSAGEQVARRVHEECSVPAPAV